MTNEEETFEDRQKREAEIIKKMGITILPDVPNQIIHVSSPEEWQKVIEGAHSNNLPIVIFFSATGCVPCQYFVPILQNVQSDFAKNMYFVHVDINEFPHLAHIFGVSGVPTTLILFHNMEIGQYVGVMPEEIFRAMVVQALRIARQNEGLK